MGADAILAKLLALSLSTIAEYKKTRDEMLAKGEVVHTDESVRSNKELIALFKSEAEGLKLNADDLIAKYELQLPKNE